MLTCFVIILLYLTSYISGLSNNDHLRSHFYHVNASSSSSSPSVFSKRLNGVKNYIKTTGNDGKEEKTTCRNLLSGSSPSIIPGIVQLAVIAPSDPNHEQALSKILPSIYLAVRSVSHPENGILPGWDIRVDYRDSNCSSTLGPLAAVEFYINKSVGE